MLTVLMGARITLKILVLMNNFIRSEEDTEPAARRMAENRIARITNSSQIFKYRYQILTLMPPSTIRTWPVQ
jgi:hypothetical protein